MKHDVCWPGDRPPVGKVRFTCPDSGKVVEMDGGYIGLTEVPNKGGCPSGTVILSR